MAQLLAGGIIALGILVIAAAIFLVQREKNVVVVPAVAPKPEQHTTTTTASPIEANVVSAPVPQQAEAKVAENIVPVVEENNHILVLHNELALPTWWHEQFHSLTTQLQELREHASDVERQIAILGEIATLAAELEGLQRKHAALPESKISLFPMKVNRQPTDVSYVTDKRPAVRKYTIKAM